jgi:hypothetical protein
VVPLDLQEEWARLGHLERLVHLELHRRVLLETIVGTEMGRMCAIQTTMSITTDSVIFWIVGVHRESLAEPVHREELERLERLEHKARKDLLLSMDSVMHNKSFKCRSSRPLKVRQCRSFSRYLSIPLNSSPFRLAVLIK